jgi:olefin beta-lactone synthetase
MICIVMEISSNVARRLSEMAQARPEAIAVVEPLDYDSHGKRQYRHVTFRELDQDSDRIAAGLRQMGVQRGTKLAVLVRPGIDFVSLVFALLKAGAVAILIDPGMGRRNLIRCLADAEPEGFIAIPIVQAVRYLLPRRFPRHRVRFNVTVGRRWFWDGVTLQQLRGRPNASTISPLPLGEGQGVRACSSANRPHPNPLPEGEGTTSDEPAAIIFTTGSTGPPKGVLFTHGNFDAQVEQIRDFYGIKPGEIDLPCFPLFGLFNCAMGVTAVIPDMDPSRPAQVDPAKIIEAARDWSATQTFGSPAIWDRVGGYCQSHGVSLPTVRRVLSAGAPVPAEVLRRMKTCIHPDGDIHTPYGATEALPVASISASEVLGTSGSPLPLGEGQGVRASSGQAENSRVAGQSALTLTLSQRERGLWQVGAGVCVGRTFAHAEWKVIRIVFGPIRSLDEAQELPTGEIGELIVRGPQITREYVTRRESNALAKIADGTGFWHRMGDSGYLDDSGRFWFCGRVAHCVRTPAGLMHPIRCEAIFNQHPDIRRSALVGVGPPGRQRPVIVLEPHKGRMPRRRQAREILLDEIRQLGAANPLTAGISDFLFHPAFPVDIRHNAKIFREKLAVWASVRCHG